MFHDFTKTESGQLMNIGITMLMFRKDDCKKSSALLSRGINVLESKSELEKALAKQRLAAEQKQKEAEVIMIMIMMIVEFDQDCDQDDA